MPFSRPVASLAIYAFGQRARINRFGERMVIFFRDIRVPVMTEHAFVPQRAAEAIVIRLVVTRVHGPITAFFGVPSQRQLDQLVGGSPVRVGTSVIAGTYDVVNLLLHYIDFLAIEADLMAALVIFSITLKHGEIAVRRLVVIRIVPGVILEGVCWCWPGE